MERGDGNPTLTGESRSHFPIAASARVTAAVVARTLPQDPGGHEVTVFAAPDAASTGTTTRPTPR
jgi:hypothetical protein